MPYKKGYFCDMKNLKFILAAGVLALSSCSQTTRSTDRDKVVADSIAQEINVLTAQKALFAKMEIKDTIKIGDLVQLRFTVYNKADSVMQFCKWHTPFEPLISKYLDIKNESGEEVSYKGAMAKRMMPPPASSYMKLNPQDSVSIDVDLLKGYAIEGAGKYTISYNSQNMSGLMVRDSISFVYIK